MFRSLFNAFRRDEHGGPAIEFALAGGFIALCVPAIMDVAHIINTDMRLSGGMRAAQEYALKYPTDAAGIAATVASASNLPPDAVEVTTQQFCGHLY